MLLDERSNETDELLRLTVAELDIPAAVRAAAIDEYNAIARWLRDSWPGAGGEIYAQGSLRLGTIVTPVTAGCDYDVDLVCRLWLTKEIGKTELKHAVGDALAAYVATRPPGTMRLEQGKRCWTLVYPGQRFHLDVLPAIPNEDEDSEDAIWLTDRKLLRWQPSNPIGYAEWFAGRMATDRLLLLEAVAAKRGIDVEDVPDDTVRTALQHGVQMLKRHRDIYFEDDPKIAPASIILTTLAAQAYQGGGEMREVLVDLTERMPELVEWRDGKYVVANPVLDDENFADRWADDPRREQAFFDWALAANEDFDALGKQPGVDRLLESLAVSLGAEPVERAGRRYAASMRDRQRRGRLITGSSGLLAAAPAVGAGITPRTQVPANPWHTFHGRSRDTQR
jgi:hypothetical protein